LRKEINIRIKTLYGKRKIFNFKCNITSHISSLIDKIGAEEDKCHLNSDQKKKERNEKIDKFEKMEKFDKNFQYRFITSNVIIISHFLFNHLDFSCYR